MSNETTTLSSPLAGVGISEMASSVSGVEGAEDFPLLLRLDGLSIIGWADVVSPRGKSDLSGC